MFTFVPGRYDASIVLLYQHLSEDADTIGGQLCGDRVPLQWRNQLWRSLEEGAGERCSECDLALQWRNQLWQSLEEGV